ncbi:MAG: aminotransferase class V-fold PLP-dependent enzyme [Ilumatobacteraceae bacterium]|nr:aminotransferase class V-fold PLP-dependent enzyme [Ilumatobacteraceae bacterium]
MIDLARVRGDTLGVDDIVHLNNCGSSLPPRSVVDAQVDYLREEQRMGGYEVAAARSDDLHDFTLLTARMLGCGVDEVAFQGSAIEGWWRAFLSIDLQPGDRVLAGTSEYQGNAFGLLQARDRGVLVETIPNDERGTIDLAALAAAIDDRVGLVCLTQVSMSNGAVHPAADVGRLCRDAGVPFLLDACQVAGQRPLDVDRLGCDFLVYTGRKFMRGPRGTGVLYARRSTVDRLGPSPFVDGRSGIWTGDDTWEHTPGAARFELGERSFAAQVGLAEATRYALDVGLDTIAERVGMLAERLRGQLAGLDRVRVRDEGDDRCGIVTFTLEGLTAVDIRSSLGAAGINIGAPGAVNARWDLGRRNIDAVARVGVHYFNSEAELDRLIEVVSDLTL